MEEMMENFCGGKTIWDTNLAWNTTTPRFTRCFQKTLPIWIPAAFLWLLAPLETYLLLKVYKNGHNQTPNRPIPNNLYNVSRLVAVICLILVNVVQLGHDLYYFTALPFTDLTTITNNATDADNATNIIHYSTLADLTSSFLYIFTFAFFAFLINLHRVHGVHTSGIAWIFTFLSFVFSLPNFYMVLMYGLDDDNFNVGQSTTKSLQLGLFVVHFSMILVVFLFTCFADRKPDNSIQKRTIESQLIINEDSNANDLKRGDEDFVNSFELISPYQQTNGVSSVALADVQQPLFENANEKMNSKRVCPDQKASFLSILTFWWFNGMAFSGFRKSLELDDLWNLNIDDTTDRVAPKFDRNWNAQINRHLSSEQVKFTRSRTLSNASKTMKVSVAVIDGKSRSPKAGTLTTLIRAFGWYFFSGAIFKFIHDLLQFVSPQLLKVFIEFVKSSSSEPIWHGFFIASSFFIISTTQSVMLNYYFTTMYSIGMRVRTALISAIYRKSLNLSNTARRETTTGEIVNLMTVDAQRFVDLLPFLNLIWSAPLQICLTIYFLWMELGPSVLAGLLVMVLMIPINGFIASYQRRLQIGQMKKKDERVKVINELLNGMRVIKLYAWEIPFIRKVNSIRDQEIDNLKKIAYISSVMSFLWTCSPFLVSFVSFAIYVLSSDENVLDAKKAFVSLSLFNLLRFPLSMLPQMITSVVMASVSVKRLNRFLNSPQLEKYVDRESELTEDVVISIENGNFCWEKKTSEEKSDKETKRTKKDKKLNEENQNDVEEKLLKANSNDTAPNNNQANGNHSKSNEIEITLNSINLQIKKGSLVAIVGHVGSGKSSLLSALLGEMECLSGSVKFCPQSSVAYVAQQAWIQNATLKENILFGKDFAKQRYKSVIEMCALKPDIAMLPGGDETEIGEKGINLSGGQKQRVAIARACYANSDIILLDDPLSAVDSHVAQHIFSKVISNTTGYLRDRTRILVTNNILLLPEVDQIVVLVNGTITEIGTYDQLMSNSGKFADFVREYSDNKQNENLDNSIGESFSDGSLRKRSTSVAQTDDHRSGGGASSDNKIIETERTETGHVKLSIYMSYFRSLTYLWLVMVLIGFVCMQIASVGSNVWLAVWSNDPPPSLNITEAEISTRNQRLSVYGALGLIQALCVMLGAFAMAKGTVHSSRVLHQSLLERIMRAPMHFFDTTPLGRIVNRFSKDIDTIDSTIPHTIRGWLICFFQVISTFILISFEIPIFMAVVLPILLLYYFIQKFYVATSRQLKRLESVTRSPIYSHFGETLSGVSTIRAYNSTKRFIAESNSRVDTNQRCYYPSFIANRWLAIRLEFCGNLIVLFSAVFAVFSRESFQHQPGFAGLIITYALSVTNTINWLVRMTSEMETNVVSVERIGEYCDNPTEREWNRPSGAEPALPSIWPQKGEIQFIDYSVRYREGLSLVLNNVTIDVHSGEKIGIVGRTGAGKSSLTLSLFRLLEAANGKIIIDGIDISQLGLHELRSKLSIIPQDPVLFSGTIRSNLDPFETNSDDQLWQALEHSHLKEYITSLDSGLDYCVAENGENLSVGQRQLICLARALLRKTKILILDEATAAIDLETDALIQTTIRTEFSDCTILTIAHRLHTILDSNRVLVLDKGRVVEFDEPKKLLSDRRSRFYGLAKDARIV